MRKNAVFFVIIIIFGVIAMLLYFNTHDGDSSSSVIRDVETINIWYTDEALTDYINSAAVAYLDEYGVRVIPELHTGLDYMDEINTASVSSDTIPDLYITGTDSIEKAAMAGLAIPVLDERNVLTNMNYPEVALDAVTYQGEKFGYPFYYETAFLLYNQSYLREIADTALRSEIEDAEDGEDEEEESAEENYTEITTQTAPPDGYSQEEWDIMVEEKMNEMIPKSIEDITNFANEYSAPENVENIFSWDVTDIFYNYFFAGAYMNIGGQYGDNPAILDIYNEDTVACLQVYQNLNQFFSIDSDESDYRQVLDEFLAGKTIFMIATTDALAEIDKGHYDGTFTWDYSVASLPGVDSEHEAKGLSSTNAVIVNGYSYHRHEADAFARYLTNDCIDNFFGRTGKLAAANGVDDYITDSTDLAREMYKVSVPLPKLFELSNFWIELELAYTLVWEGADVDETLSALQEKMNTQINGN